MDRLDNLAVFLAVAERGSFAEAARALHRSPAAVTRAVAALEEELRVRLLTRTTRSVVVTEAGQRALEMGRSLLNQLEALESIGAGEAADPRGLVSLTAPSMFGRLHVLPLVHRFLPAHPGIDVRFLLEDRVVSLVDEGVDLAVRLGNLPDSSLISQRVGAVRRGIFASPAYLDEAGIPRDLDDLARFRVISCLALNPLPERWSFAGPGGTRIVPVKPRLIVSTPDAAVESAVAGIGLTCVGSYQAEAEVAAGRLVEVLGELAPTPVPITLVQPAGRHAAPRVRLLVEFLAQGLRRKFG